MENSVNYKTNLMKCKLMWEDAIEVYKRLDEKTQKTVHNKIVRHLHKMRGAINLESFLKDYYSFLLVIETYLKVKSDLFINFLKKVSDEENKEFIKEMFTWFLNEIETVKTGKEK